MVVEGVEYVIRRSLVEPVPHESWSEEESSEERSDRSRLSRLMRSARGPGS